MLLLISCFFIMEVTLIGLMLKIFSNLKSLVGYLPETFEKERIMIEPIIGKNISEYLPISTDFLTRSTIIMVASATCSTCHETLEEFLQKKAQDSIPFVCYLLSTDDEYLKFVAKYNNEFPIYQVSKERILSLGMEITPSFLLTNDKGIVETVNHFADSIIDLYKKNKRET